MKKIINGKKYDTETAKLIGADSYGGSKSDFNYWEEALYKKVTGEFFLYGEGGAKSKYGIPIGDMWGYGEKIIPLTLSEAKAWAEEHMSVDNYESVFGIVEE